jgi:hypothetical protein
MGPVLIWRRLNLFALAALSIDMLGAIYTHSTTNSRGNLKVRSAIPWTPCECLD